MSEERLKEKINLLKQLLDLKDFINDYYADDYKITIKKTICGIDSLFTEKAKLIISKEVLKKIVSSLIENLENEMEVKIKWD